MKRKTLAAFIFSFTLLGSCNFTNVSHQVHSLPSWSADFTGSRDTKIILASTGNIKGKITPTNFSIELAKTKKKVSYDVGGMGALSAYLKILRKRYPKNLLLVDSGDLITKDSTAEQSRNTFLAYDYLRYDSIAWGPEELLFHHNLQLNEEAQKLDSPIKHLPFVNSSIIDLKTGSPFQPGKTANTKVVEIEGVKVGIIGLVSLEKVKKMNNGVSPNGLYFEDSVLSVIKHHKELRSKGANIIVLLANLSSQCKTNDENSERSYEDRYNFQIKCPKGDSLWSLANRLPPNTVDVIVAGAPSISSGYIKDTPVILNSDSGFYLSMLEFKFDQKEKKLIKEATNIRPAVKLCHSFFKGTLDCVGNDKEKILEAGMEKAKFLGIPVDNDDSLSQLMSH